MKKYIYGFVMIVMATAFAACGNKEANEPVKAPAEPAPVVQTYQPTHETNVVDLQEAKKYNYYSAPKGVPAVDVTVDYDQKLPFKKPVTVTYRYENDDVVVYVIPADFGLWKNENGRFRVVVDSNNTVWVQGSTQAGKFHEFVFYGDPKYNGSKIKPNSYRNLPAGEITYQMK